MSKWVIEATGTSALKRMAPHQLLTIAYHTNRREKHSVIILFLHHLIRLYMRGVLLYSVSKTLLAFLARRVALALPTRGTLPVPLVPLRQSSQCPSKRRRYMLPL